MNLHPNSNTGLQLDYDPADGLYAPMDADGLLTALDNVILEGTHDWLTDAVVTACATGDLLFLQRQVERHVKGWVTP